MSTESTGKSASVPPPDGRDSCGKNPDLSGLFPDRRTIGRARPSGRPLLMREVCIVHYDEVALKRGRRDYYEGRLRLAVQNAVRDLGTVAVETLYGRLLAWRGRTDVPIDVLAER
ncbi:MAG TPA: hypothetical protein VEI02_09505, partial [Planctomycetota bacterium]|nr:hypothetical protein [Planctomycetota bacterium]